MGCPELDDTFGFDFGKDDLSESGFYFGLEGDNVSMINPLSNS